LIILKKGKNLLEECKTKIHVKNLRGTFKANHENQEKSTTPTKRTRIKIEKAQVSGNSNVKIHEKMLN